MSLQPDSTEAGAAAAMPTLRMLLLHDERCAARGIACLDGSQQATSVGSTRRSKWASFLPVDLRVAPQARTDMMREGTGAERTRATTR